MSLTGSSPERESAQKSLIRIVSALAIAVILYGVILLANQVFRYVPYGGYLAWLLWQVYCVILALIIIFVGIIIYRSRNAIPTLRRSSRKLSVFFLIMIGILPVALMSTWPSMPTIAVGTWLSPPFEREDIFALSEIIVNRTIVVTIYQTSNRFDPSRTMAQGDYVTVKVVNEDNVPRAFAIEEFNISSGAIAPKTSITLDFVPTYEGSYKAYCPISGRIYGYVKVRGAVPTSKVQEAAQIIVDNVGIDYFMTYFKFKESYKIKDSMTSLQGDLIDAYHVMFHYWIGIKDFETIVTTQVTIGVDNASVVTLGIPDRLEDPTKGMPYNIDEDDAIETASMVLPLGVDGYHADFHECHGDLQRYVWSVSTYFTDPNAWRGNGKSAMIDPYSGEILETRDFFWTA